MRTWRSWPWTLALAGILGGFAFLGLVGLGLRTSAIEIGLSMLVIVAALAGMLRVLATGVRATPSGLIIRDLTRTTMIEWARVRKITCEQTDRRGVHAPVLRVAPAAGLNRGGARESSDVAGRGKVETVQVTVLGSYRLAVAQRRTDELEAARAGASRRTR
jgi:hypothetical protein